VSRSGILRTPELASPPQGDPRNLNGAPRKMRVVWSDPASLVLSDRPPPVSP
jgi:hypothetical protein